jgi:ABC-2 type transport system permease protein
MLRNVYTKTLYDQRRGLVGWGIGVAVTVALMAALWPAFEDMDMTALVEQYPQALKDLFDVDAMTTASGYLNAELFSIMFPVMFIIFGAARGARLIAGEEEDGTLEPIAALPLRRWELLLAKAAALVTGLAVLTVVLFVSLVVMSVALGLDIAVVHALNGSLAMFFLGTEFGLLALALSAATGRRTLSLGITAGVAGAGYVLYLAAQLVDAIEPYRVLSPFYQAISEGPIGPTFGPLLLVLAAVGSLALALALPRFQHRDLGA